LSGLVDLQRDGALAFVTLAQPAKFNAMSRAMWRQLRELFLALHAQPGLRVIVLQGQGGHFCAGGDIAEYTDFRFEPEGLRAFHEGDVWGGLSAVLDCDVPVIAAIEGHCMGAGLAGC